MSTKRYKSLRNVLQKYVDEPTDETYTDACDAIYGYIEEALGDDGLEPGNETFEDYKKAVGAGNVGPLDKEIFDLSDKASMEDLSPDEIKILLGHLKAYIKAHTKSKTHTQGGGGTRKSRKTRSRKSRSRKSRSRKSRSRTRKH